MSSGIRRLYLGKLKEKGFVVSERFSIEFLSCDYFEIVGFESITYINGFICMVRIILNGGVSTLI